MICDPPIPYDEYKRQKEERYKNFCEQQENISNVQPRYRDPWEIAKANGDIKEVEHYEPKRDYICPVCLCNELQEKEDKYWCDECEKYLEEEFIKKRQPLCPNCSTSLELNYSDYEGAFCCTECDKYFDKDLEIVTHLCFECGTELEYLESGEYGCFKCACENRGSVYDVYDQDKDFLDANMGWD